MDYSRFRQAMAVAAATATKQMRMFDPALRKWLDHPPAFAPSRNAL
jgi:hypothetical protein